MSYSDQQAAILRELWRCYQHACVPETMSTSCRLFLRDGVPKRPLVKRAIAADGQAWTRSVAASTSRALRRLELRGDIERSGGMIRLTAKGCSSAYSVATKQF